LTFTETLSRVITSWGGTSVVIVSQVCGDLERGLNVIEGEATLAQARRELDRGP
jgi:hypothetical protein